MAGIQLGLHCASSSVGIMLASRHTWNRTRRWWKAECFLTLSAFFRADQWSHTWDLNPRPFRKALMFTIHMLIHWTTRNTTKHEHVESTSLRWSVLFLSFCSLYNPSIQHNSRPPVLYSETIHVTSCSPLLTLTTAILFELAILDLPLLFLNAVFAYLAKFIKYVFITK